MPQPRYCGILKSPNFMEPEDSLKSILVGRDWGKRWGTAIMIAGGVEDVIARYPLVMWPSWSVEAVRNIWHMVDSVEELTFFLADFILYFYFYLKQFITFETSELKDRRRWGWTSFSEGGSDLQGEPTPLLFEVILHNWVGCRRPAERVDFCSRLQKRGGVTSCTDLSQWEVHNRDYVYACVHNAATTGHAWHTRL